ncbi:MAG: DUF1343 domain-containing protein [Cyclobacteriaceae bacterium]
MRRFYFLCVFGVIFCSCTAQQDQSQSILPGAYQMNEYLPLIKGKRVGLLVNHSSLVGTTHLVDTLLSLDINIVKAYSPEHGFSGTKADGEVIKDQETPYDFEVISLYGSSKEPAKEQMEGVDVMIFDIQDVGIRFYTYPSTMTYMMQACAKYKIPFIVLDRPNPHGGYVDGPVMQDEHKSFIGMHPVPLVHGLTMGEMAMMINDEGWLKNGLYCDLTVVAVRNWTHATPYSLPVAPSPNLPNDLAIALYPSLGFFERTIASVGRGTEYPFQVIGHPDYPDKDFSFTPTPNEGSKYPPLEGEKCFGVSLVGSEPKYEFNLSYLIDFYQKMNGQTDKPFFTKGFERHAGTKLLQQQIEAGWSEDRIRASWQEELKAFHKIRNKYLLYE